ncbi:MAG TPA: pyridoxamine 5'-phosphate oxidase family protein [Ktedonobacterales bacterium]
MADDHQRAEPESSRPSLGAEYGIAGSTAGAGLLPWAWAAERLAGSRGYWIATTRPEGRPHMAVVWGVWLQDRFIFSTAANSRKARNLAANSACVVCPEGADEAISVEGAAERVTDAQTIAAFADAYAAKYQEDANTGGVWMVFQVRPSVVFAFISDAEQYPTTATRWRFRA